MREGGKILGEVFEKIESIIKPGVSTYELDIFAEKIIRAHKDALPGFKGYRGFPATLCTSVNEEVVHGIPKKDRILKDGDIIGVDCGVLYGGFYTDACITYAVGSITPQVIRFLNVTKQALDKSIEEVKPGNRIGDISAVIQETLESNGYAPVVECTGHGVGRALHEPPDILNVGYKNSGPMMKPGMMLAIEPISVMGSGKVTTSDDGWTIISADRKLSAHFEHTVLVTEKGYEIIV